MYHLHICKGFTFLFIPRYQCYLPMTTEYCFHEMFVNLFLLVCCEADELWFILFES